jgi:ribose transport system substrate-binding protein
MRIRTKALGTAVALTLTLGTASACSSSSSGGGSKTTGGGGTSAGGGGGGNAGMAQAQATVEQYSKTPASINITTPLSKKPATGKKIIVVESSEPTSLKTDAGFKEAASALGWSVSIVPEGTGPEDPAKAFGQAIDAKPDAIFISGNPLSTMRSQVDRAKQQHIIVIQSDAGEPAGQDGTVYRLSLDDFNQTGLWGKMIADYVAVKGSKHALLVDLSLYPILHAFTTSAQNELKQVSPSTKTDVMDVQIKDFIAGKVPSTIVSEVQRHPDIDFVVLSLGDMATGLGAALRGAGLSKVRVGGESAGTPNLQGLRSKEQTVYTGFADLIHGWRRADAAARIFNGDSLGPNNNSKLPTQLLTQDNIGSAVLDQNGDYIGVKDFREQYKALWKLSS